MEEQAEFERLFTLAEFCDILRMEQQAVRLWIKAGKIRAYMPGRKILIPASELRRLLESSAVGAE